MSPLKYELVVHMCFIYDQNIFIDIYMSIESIIFNVNILFYIF